MLNDCFKDQLNKYTLRIALAMVPTYPVSLLFYCMARGGCVELYSAVEE